MSGAARLLALALLAATAGAHTASAQTAPASDEALTSLWNGFLKTGVSTGLAAYGERLYPLIRIEMERCRDGEGRRCADVNRVIEQLPAPPPYALDLWEATVRSTKADIEVRRAARDRLVAHRHPYGLQMSVAELSGFAKGLETALGLGPGPVVRDDDTERLDQAAAAAFQRIGRYGDEAAGAGPKIAPYLTAHRLPRARAAAALALGQIGYRAGAPAILAQRASFEDDWLFAYNAAEALGRLGAGETTLKALAQDHWYAPVRNNAARALSLLRGGPFAARVDGGAAATKVGPLGLELRYAADMPQALVRNTPRCWPTGWQDYRGPDPAPAWPARDAKGPMRLTLRGPDAAQEAALRAAHPELKTPRNSPLAFAFQIDGHWLIGSDAGEWGGSVDGFAQDKAQGAYIEDNAIAAFPLRDGVLVATGLSHLLLSQGDLWVMGRGANHPRVLRRIRLPTEPQDFRVAWPDTLIFVTGGQEVAVDQSGHLTDAARLRMCRR